MKEIDVDDEFVSGSFDDTLNEEELLEDDEISDTEEGFLRGYGSA